MPTIKVVPFPGAPGPRGEQGPRGYQGDQGLSGLNGTDGKSAYEIAVDNGFQGTEQQWLDSLGGGGTADIADFVFTYDNEIEQSTMSVANHDMRIETTRLDLETDADIEIASADDIWIRAEGDELSLYAANTIQLGTGENPNFIIENRTVMFPDGPQLTSDSNTVVTPVPVNVTANLDYIGQDLTGTTGEAVFLAPTAELSAFSAAVNTGSPWSGTITFADNSSQPLVAIYPSNMNGPEMIVFQWTTPANISFPVTITGTYDNYTYDKSLFVGMPIPNSSETIGWTFNNDETITFPDGSIQETAYPGPEDTKTWTASSGGVYEIKQAHGGIEVQLPQPQSWGENITIIGNVVNSNTITIAVSMDMDAVLTNMSNGTEYFRMLALEIGPQTRYFRINNQVEPGIWVLYLPDSTITAYDQNVYYLQAYYGGAPVLWWDADNLQMVPVGDEWKFRGAKIEYHAYSTDSGTIIGTIYIANDNGDNYVTHLETNSGVNDAGTVVLWNRSGTEKQLYAYRTDNEDDIVKIHWTAQVYYGTEFYD